MWEGLCLRRLKNRFRPFKVEKNSSKHFDARWALIRGYVLQGYSEGGPSNPYLRPCVGVRSCTAGDRCEKYRLETGSSYRLWEERCTWEVLHVSLKEENGEFKNSMYRSKFVSGV